MTMHRYLDPKNDLAFRRIFASEANKDILIAFLNDMLQEGLPRICDVDFKQTIQDPMLAALKTSIVDVICEDEKGHTYIVEMQMGRESDFKKRSLYYACKSYALKLRKAQPYRDLRGVIFIAILNYTLFPHKENYISHHALMDRETHEMDLDGLYFTFMELSKFDKDRDHLLSSMDQWAYFFKHTSELEKDDPDRWANESICKAYEELELFNWDSDDLLVYDRIERRLWGHESVMQTMFEDGRQEGVDVGRKEGLKEGLRETARNLKNMGTSMETIEKATGLSWDEIDGL